MYLNKVYLIGNLTRDPELKALPSGTKVASFSVATNRTFRDKDGNRQDQTEFHNVVAFAKLGELSAQYLKKGAQALIEGRIQTRSWDDAATNSKKYRTEIIADNIQFGTRAGGAPAGAPSAAASSSASSAPAAKSGKADSKGPADAAPAGDAIEYPEEDINPDDIPF